MDLSKQAVSPRQYQEIKEGSAKIIYKGTDVFYNKAQVVNRDLSILVMKYFSKVLQKEKLEGKWSNKRNNKKKGTLVMGNRPEGLDGLYVFEGLSATGLRAIRYAQEVDYVSKVIANDYDQNSYDSIVANIDHNGDVAKQKVEASFSDARMVMLQNPGVFDVVDIDPYGTPSQLLDTAVQAVRDGGLLMVTATDMAVLCGNNGEACFNKYGSYPLHKHYCHEQALRILLYTIEVNANRYKRYIEPIISASIDFYIRIFVRVYTSPQEIKESANKMSYVYQSCGCDSYELQKIAEKKVKNNQVRYMASRGPVVPQECPDTGAHYQMGGPIWSNPIHDMNAIGEILGELEQQEEQYQASQKIRAMLKCIQEELVDVPLYFSIHSVAGTFKCHPPKMEVFKSALLNGGYRVSGFHANPLAVKTDAPWDFIFDIMRKWVQQQPIRKPEDGSYLEKMISKEITHDVDFTMRLNPYKKKQQKMQEKARGRFPKNPENWGPIKANNMYSNFKVKRKNFDRGLQEVGNVKLQNGLGKEGNNRQYSKKQKDYRDIDKFIEDDVFIEKYNSEDEKSQGDGPGSISESDEDQIKDTNNKQIIESNLTQDSSISNLVQDQNKNNSNVTNQSKLKEQHMFQEDENNYLINQEDDINNSTHFIYQNEF